MSPGFKQFMMGVLMLPLFICLFLRYEKCNEDTAVRYESFTSEGRCTEAPVGTFPAGTTAYPGRCNMMEAYARCHLLNSRVTVLATTVEAARELAATCGTTSSNERFSTPQDWLPQ